MTSVPFCKAKESAVDKHCSKKNRPFAAKPSRDLLYIKLWTKPNARNGKSMSKISKWPSLRPSSLNKKIL